MKIAVTGATGFIGKHFCTKISSAGQEIVCLGRHALEGHEFQHFDLGEETDNPVNWRGIDALVHLAARIPANHADQSEAEKCFRTNALGTIRLMHSAMEGGVGRIIQTVSANAYTPDNNFPDELAQLLPTQRAAYYLVSKIAQEAFSTQNCAKAMVPLVTLRLSSVFGKGQQAGAIPKIARQLASSEQVTLENGGIFGADFVDVEDVVACLIAVLEPSAAGGAYNIGSGRRSTMSEIAVLLAGALQRPSSLISVRPVSAQTERGFPALDIRKARNAFGYAPRSLQESIDAFAGIN
jgi:UDP-glucose 4-epimerase